MKILLIGPLMETIGGTQISFMLLANELSMRKHIDIIIISVKGIRGSGLKAIPRFLRLIFDIIINAGKSDIVSLHASITGVPYIGPVVLIICKIFKRPMIYRMFGGMDHNGLCGIKKLIAHLVAKKADLYLVQTNLLAHSALKNGFNNFKWFPTCRKLLKGTVKIREKCKKFVFIGQLRIEKGLKELSEAAENLPDGLEVHVWGPWKGLNKEFFKRYKRIKIMGCLKPSEVSHTLMQYDVLVLPTYLKEEGYSGVIFEAYAAGLPVIATRWLSLPDIVINEKTGLLVNPFDVESLRNAMIRLSVDKELYQRVCIGAKEFVKSFSIEIQADRFINYCNMLKSYNQK